MSRPIRIAVFLLAGLILLAGLYWVGPLRHAALTSPTAELHIQKGLQAYREQAFFRAVDEFQKALVLEPKNAHAMYYLGQVYETSGRIEEAAGFYAQAREADPALQASYYNLALAYGLRKAPGMAEKVFLASLELSPDASPAWFGLAEIYYGQGKWVQARTAYLRAKDNPDAAIDRTRVEQNLADIETQLAESAEPVTKEKVKRGLASSRNDLLCLRCHGEVEKRHNRRGVEQSANCTGCHLTHNMVYRPLLPVPEKNRCQVCHFEYDRDAVTAAQARGNEVHMPVQNGNCTDCHQPHDLGEKSELRIERAFLCFSCHRDHKRERDRLFQHSPYDKAFCTDCHDPHISEEKKLLRTLEQNLCLNCHFAFNEVTGRPLQHQPFVTGRCTSCHEAHAADYKGLLRVDQKRLCYSCHFDRDLDLTKPVKHRPFAEGRCTHCHDPHAAMTAGLLPAATQAEFCYLCHNRVKITGPLHHPLVPGVSCTNCHSPHAGWDRALFPAKEAELCISCHLEAWGSTLAEYKDSEHGKLGCTDCHGREGLGFAFRTPQEKLNVCFDCHPAYRIRADGQLIQRAGYYSHPFGQGYRDPLTRQMLICSSCHNPHGSGHKKMLMARGDGLCMKCHQK